MRTPAGVNGEPSAVPSPAEAGGRRLFGLERNVLVAGVVSFFMDVSSEMVYPLVPLFLSSVLGVPKSVIGLIEGVAEATASLLKVASGWYSDRIGRRKGLMGAGYGISAVSRVGLALAGSWGHVLGARFVDRLGKGIRSAPRDAIIADSSPRGEIARGFGFHRAMDQFGAVLGPGVAFLVLAWRPEDYRTVFWVSLVPGLIAVAVLAVFIRERRRPRSGRAGPPGVGVAGREALSAVDRGGSGVGAGGRPWTRLGGVRTPLFGYLLVTGLFALGNSSDAFLVLRAEDVGVSAVLIPVVYLVFNLVYSGLSIPAGLFADRFGRRRLLVFGFLLFAATYAGLALAREPEHVWALFVLYGVYMGFTDGNGRALLAELAPSERRATAFGAYHAVVGMAALPASAAAGVLWDAVSPAAPFWLGAVTAVAAAILLPVLVRSRPAHP